MFTKLYYITDYKNQGSDNFSNTCIDRHSATYRVDLELWGMNETYLTFNCECTLCTPSDISIKIKKVIKIILY